MNVGSRTEVDGASSLLVNDQLVGGGGVILGDTGQTNRQGNDISQTLLGGKIATSTQKASNPTIGNSTLTATNTAVSLLANGQGVAPGSIVGSVQQASSQGHNDKQGIKQSPAPVITGNYAPVQLNESAVLAANCQTVSDGSSSCLVLSVGFLAGRRSLG